jgi:peptidoglycan-N-acetylglucosamine deacetylase
VRLPPREMAEQVDRAAAVLEGAVGARPRGFRAPGYTVSDALLAVVARSGARYDASVLPCPAYFAAKTFVLGAMRLAGRPSASILGSARVLSAPVEPYRIGVPYTRGGSGLLEIPVGVTPGARLPFLGTLLVLVGPRGARWLARAMRPRALASLELHGIDLCDAAADGLSALADRQPDLRVGLERKRASLQAALQQLGTDGRRFVRLEEVV